MNENKGNYMSLISPDGGGKDTVFKELVKDYPQAVQMYEPGGTKEADVIREILLSAEMSNEERKSRAQELFTSGKVSYECEGYLLQAIAVIDKEGLTGEAEAYLYAASRAETNQKVIIPTLQENGLILSRRSVACSMSYQGYARGLGMDTIWEINKKALANAYPTLEIYIDVPAEVAQERIKGRTEKQDRLDKEEMSFHEKTVIGYKTYYEKYCPYPYIIIDGTKTKEELLEDVKNIVKKHLETA